MRRYYRSPLPNDLLNIVGSYIGDTTYQLMFFGITSSGNLSISKMSMQERGKAPKHRPREHFYYIGHWFKTLVIESPKIQYVTKYRQAEPTFKSRLDRLRSYLDCERRENWYTRNAKLIIQKEVETIFPRRNLALKIRAILIK